MWIGKCACMCVHVPVKDRGWCRVLFSIAQCLLKSALSWNPELADSAR